MVLITAISVLTIVALLSLAIVTTVNVQTSQTAYETRGEAAFNLAETALDAEVYQLQLAWPGSGVLPLTCNQSTPQQLPTTQQVGCEGAALTGLNSSYAGAAYFGATWSVQVLDDVNNTEYHYSDSLATATPAAPSYDSNGNGRMWIRAQATVRGQTRSLVEQVVRQNTVLTLPDNTVTAGGVYSENNGNKVIIQARDSTSGLTGNVEVRCQATQPVQGQGNCLGWDADKSNDQLSPPTAYGSSYTDQTGTDQTLTDTELTALQQTAMADGTYYPNAQGACPPDQPPDPNLTVIFIADATTCPAYNGKTEWFSAANPGILVVAKGSLTFTGNEVFHGVIYMENQPLPNPPTYPCDAQNMNTVLTVDGNALIDGAVFVDGCGAVATGDSATNVMFDSSALNALEAVETATPAQNTFREMQ